MAVVQMLMEPENLDITKIDLDYPADGTPATGTISIIGDHRELEHTENLFITVTMDDGSFVRRGPFKTLHQTSFSAENQETTIPIVQQGREPYDFVPVMNGTIEQNLDRNWPRLIGKERIPSWLLAVQVEIPLETAVDFGTGRDYFNYLLGGFGYFLIREGSNWILGGGAVEDHIFPAPVDVPIEEGEHIDGTLTAPSGITVRGKEEKLDTPPPETEEQRRIRERKERILREAIAQGRVTREEQYEITPTDALRLVVEETKDIQPQDYGYRKVTEWREKADHCETKSGRETINVQKMSVVSLDGAATELPIRHTETTETENYWGKLGAKRVSTGGKTVTTDIQEILGTPPADLDPPLDMNSYSKRTTVTARKTWTTGGWVRVLAEHTLEEQLKNSEVISSSWNLKVTTWFRNRPGKWTARISETIPEERPIYGDDGEIAYYATFYATRSPVTVDSGPPEMAPQSDDGLRNLAEDSGGENQYSIIPEALIIGAGYGDAITIDFPYMRGQTAVDQSADLLLRLRAQSNHSRTRRYFLPVAAVRGLHPAVAAVRISADLEADSPYVEEVETQWSA